LISALLRILSAGNYRGNSSGEIDIGFCYPRYEMTSGTYMLKHIIPNVIVRGGGIVNILMRRYG
jgi:hypothetical protein